MENATSTNDERHEAMSSLVDETTRITLATTTAATESKQKNRVRFCNDDNTRHEIPNIDDLSSEEKGAVWYCESEFKQMKRSSHETVKKMMMGTQLWGNMRGLEAYTKQGSVRQRRNIHKARYTVLREQERQRVEFESQSSSIALSIDQVKIAQAYRNSSVLESERAASIRGLRDAAELVESQQQLHLKTHSRTSSVTAGLVSKGIKPGLQINRRIPIRPNGRRMAPPAGRRRQGGPPVRLGGQA